MAMPRLGIGKAKAASRVIAREFGHGTPEELEMHEALGLVPYWGFDRVGNSGHNRTTPKKAARIPEFYDEGEEAVRNAFQGSSHLALVQGFNRGNQR